MAKKIKIVIFSQINKFYNKLVMKIYAHWLEWQYIWIKNLLSEYKDNIIIKLKVKFIYILLNKINSLH
jgi:hypothetical protein